MNILERLAEGIETHSPSETIAIASELLEVLPREAILALEGDLGAGKTTFVKGLAEGMGIQDLITSPTFNIYNTYRHQGKTLVHMDAYRLDPETNAVDELMIEDFLVSPYCLAIEWPSRLGTLPWTPSIALDLKFDGPGVHRIRTLR